MRISTSFFPKPFGHIPVANPPGLAFLMRILLQCKSPNHLGFMSILREQPHPNQNLNFEIAVSISFKSVYEKWGGQQL